MDRQSDSNFKIFRPKKVFWLFQATNQFTQQNFFPINAVGITFDVELFETYFEKFQKTHEWGKIFVCANPQEIFLKFESQ